MKFKPVEVDSEIVFAFVRTGGMVGKWLAVLHFSGNAFDWMTPGEASGSHSKGRVAKSPQRDNGAEGLGGVFCRNARDRRGLQGLASYSMMQLFIMFVCHEGSAYLSSTKASQVPRSRSRRPDAYLPRHLMFPLSSNSG